MDLNILEILALITIAWSLIKLTTILISPKTWMDFAGKLMSKKRANITSNVTLILALVVGYYLLQAGMTITEILAVALFIMLLIVGSLTNIGPEIIAKMKKIGYNNILKEYFLIMFIWLILMLWGIKEIFF